MAEYYPRRRDPVLGVWAHRQALAARDAGAHVRVIALERPLPTADAARTALRGRPAELVAQLAAFARQPGRETLDGIEIDYVRFASPPRERAYGGWHRWARRPLRRALDGLHRRERFDLVHSHYAVPAGAAVRPWAEENGLPHVVSVHGGDLLAPTLAAPAVRATVAEVLRRSAAVLCNSRATLLGAAALAGSDERMRVVHPPGAPAPAELPAKRDEPTIATLGHVIPRKRHADVLEALHALRERMPGLRWVVIGDGPAGPELRARARDLGLDGRVEWLGALPPGRALEELARCHLMAMPSVDEAFGVAYVEALACGVPAIGCAGEGGPEEIARLVEGMTLVPPRQPTALADAIEGLLGDRARLRTLSAGARRAAERSFSMAACGRATLDAYRGALTA